MDFRNPTPEEKKMDKQLMAKAFNEWMRRYTESPEEFQREFQTVSTFLAESKDGAEASYGDICAEYLLKIASALEA
jgi:hypothetical protein